MSQVLSFCCYGARVLVVDAAGSDVSARLSVLLPRQMHVADAAEPDVRYEVRAGAPEETTEPAAYEVTRGGQPCFRAATVEAIVGWLRSDIDLRVGTHAREGLFVHAGVVGWRGHAILVPGRSMTGKSSLVAELVRRGALYYSDEYAVLDERGRVHPYARPLSLRNGARPDPTALGNDVGATTGRESLPVALIVSTAYQEGAPWCPITVTGARAVLPLIDNTVLAATAPTRTVRLAAMLAPSVVTLQGLRPDAGLVAPRVLQFVDDLLDGRQAASEPASDVIASRPWGSAYDQPQSRLAARDLGESEQPDVRSYHARHLRIENVLDPEEHRRLLEYVVAREAEFRPGKVFRVGGGVGVVDPELRRARNKNALNDVWDLFDLRLRRLLPHVRRVLGIPWFPLARIERHLVVHADGDFFGVHVDNGREQVASRRITAVYYFHEMPKRFTGGELRLYDGVLREGRIEPASTYTALEPLDNSLVFFPSQLFHEVCPVQGHTTDFRDSRFTVNIWYWAEQPPGVPRKEESERTASGGQPDS